MAQCLSMTKNVQYCMHREVDRCVHRVKHFRGAEVEHEFARSTRLAFASMNGQDVLVSGKSNRREGY